MIRTVAGRLAARARPNYIGRHRRARPVLHRVFRLPAATGPAAVAVPAQSAAGR
ncbi:hypothetical protein [Glycomyces sp. NRRL B-16210]|uniref:hypothetical protein n=1 Tax=Glycomyces sp. NRRL B-16210 TaxID=1463821 RepID=UPI000B081355|nr:hypothetical protein [Glycomyces sp. NRRL B-16210]